MYLFGLYTTDVITKVILHALIKGQGHTCNCFNRRGQSVKFMYYSNGKLFYCDITHTETEWPIQGPIRDNDHIFQNSLTFDKVVQFCSNLHRFVSWFLRLFCMHCTLSVLWVIFPCKRAQNQDCITKMNDLSDTSFCMKSNHQS